MLHLQQICSKSSREGCTYPLARRHAEYGGKRNYAANTAVFGIGIGAQAPFGTLYV
jgi:hypothetical protein